MKKIILPIIIVLISILFAYSMKFVKNNVKTNFIKTTKISTNYKSNKSKIKINNVEEDDDGNANYISIDSIYIFGSNGINSGSVKLSDLTILSAKQAFGNPNSETTEYSEIDEKDMNVLDYNYAKFYFIENSLKSVEIKEESFGVEIIQRNGNHLLKSVGTYDDDIWQTYNSSFSSGDGYGMTIYLKSKNGTKLDDSLNFDFLNNANSVSPGSNTITRITIKCE